MFVKGFGPPNARIVGVGEAPGEQENFRGRPFVGYSGKDLHRYASEQGIDIDSEVFLTNLVRLRPPNNADPTLPEIQRDEPHLINELRRIGPEYVLGIGRFSTWWLMGAPLTDKGKPLLPDMEMVHGIPQGEVKGPWGKAILIPTLHPAYGLHSPDQQNHIVEDWKTIAGVVRGELPPHPPEDQYPNPIYLELRDDDGHPAIDHQFGFLDQLPDPTYIAIDTEGSRANPWGLSFSFEEGTGFVVRRDQHHTLAELGRLVAHPSVVTILHGALHDLPVLGVMGVVPSRFLCTMQMLYSLCLYPQALKPASYRIAGIREVKSYEDVVGPAGHELVMGYLQRILARRCGRCRGAGEVIEKNPRGTGIKITKCPECGGDGTSWPTPETVAVWENGKPKPYTPMSIGRRVRKIISDVEAGKDTDPRERCDEEILKVVATELGPLPVPTLDDIPLKEAVDYSAGDADKTLRIFHPLKLRCAEAGLWPVLDIDHRIIPMCVRMMDVGMGVDHRYFARLTKEYRGEMRGIENTIRDMVGKYVNPSSSKQVAELLFKDLGLPVIRLTKSKEGESTDDKVLETLKVRTKHPVIDHLVRYRELHKLVGTYTTAIPEKRGRDGRVHTRIRTTRTTSGRLSAFDPNLMNIPVRSESGKQIRRGFVVLGALVEEYGLEEVLKYYPELVGWYDSVLGTRNTLLGSWDLDQIEMRILAHESNDPNLVKLFTEGYECRVYKREGKCKCHDIHLLTASLIYRKPIEQITGEERTLAKNVGFGIMYGLTAKGLRDQMAVRGQNWSEEECQAMIDAYLEDAYPGVKEYMDRQQRAALLDGYVVDMFGRRRYVRAVHSASRPVASEALRQSGNHGIQSGAQGVIKLIMARVWEKVLPSLWKKGFKVEVLVQIHDSLEIEFETGLEDLLDPMLGRVFSEAVDLRVPIGGKGMWGMRWSDLKD